MANDPSSWGILGNPSPEKIKQWQDLPVGEFKKMVKELSKKAKNRTPKEQVIFVTKKVSQLTRGSVTVTAFDMKHALDLAMNSTDIKWDTAPFKEGHEEYSYSYIDPATKYK